jgi:hypothetical protein
MLVSGAVLSGRRSSELGLISVVAGSGVLLAVVVGLAAYGQADRLLRDGRALARSEPAVAIERLQSARDWNPWDAETLAALGRIAERAGAPVVAADYYAEAGRYSQSPWLQHFREARAAKAAGDEARRLSACARAHGENPSETRLFWALCPS